MTKPEPPFQSPEIAAVFAGFPAGVRPTLLAVREVLFSEAHADTEVGEVSETLKWGQPSYVPTRANTGTPLRLGVAKTGEAAVFVHCQTTVVHDFQSLFPDAFVYEGNRAVLLSDLKEEQRAGLRMLIRSCLRYKL
ncbi:DUF1801 domain-containing protein [Halocynthiibacter sp. C4]|uniref:DUF1801 domain-containing protein n=1 Tax=Halocynthiibacter sp. C4 TaxID=2992758 RepID=UPI00237ABCE4|nr:DUF1801 domain-containing protein [Halocynthiibacter sp. C4]MDE0588410.1 DUF1801 domain-containing protein [Halocynthiibacter sp. C4]